jgi:glucose/arabinose dehydrogenase
MDPSVACQQQSQQRGTVPPRKGTFQQPRLIRTAPNGDLFVADSGAGIIFVLRGVGPDGKARQVERFAAGLDHPFGIAFYPSDNPKFVYVANTTSVVRFAYQSGDLHASGGPQTIVPSLTRLCAAYGWWALDTRCGLYQGRPGYACICRIRLERG